MDVTYYWLGLNWPPHGRGFAKAEGSRESREGFWRVALLQQISNDCDPYITVYRVQSVRFGNKASETRLTVHGARAAGPSRLNNPMPLDPKPSKSSRIGGFAGIVQG